MEFRRANEKDIPTLVENRLEFVQLIRKIENIDNFREATVKYLEEHIAKDDMVIILAWDGNIIASICMACCFQTIPLPSCHSGHAAELLNVYTIAKYRRQGLAEQVLRLLIDELRKLNVEKVVLEATDMGATLYKKLGFISLNNQMKLEIGKLCK